uniref:Peptidase metallopeptidase domain-containing protein n=1 Tax=Mycena chlorophos TaxID=658473 RepID=A0ABQ0LUK2_MYCCL|nr:predicted protein [Mycena chlorophos]
MSTDYSNLHTCAIRSGGSDDNHERLIASVGRVEGALESIVAARLDKLWDSSAIVTYSFADGTKNQRDKVEQVLAEWFPYANITFEKKDLGTIRIGFEPAHGSWSYVGKTIQQVAAPGATMNLGWITDDEKANDSDRALILHEFGHCLGLFHEHQSSKITVDHVVAEAYYSKTQGWDKDAIAAKVLNTYKDADISNYSAADTTSVMRLFMPSAMNLERVDVPANHVLSSLDKASMVINYPRPKPHDKAPEWTLKHALDISSVDADTSQKILDAHAVNDIALVRKLFATFQVATRMKAAPVVPAPAVDPLAPKPQPVPEIPSATPTPFSSQLRCGHPAQKTPDAARLQGVVELDHEDIWDLGEEITYGFLPYNQSMLAAGDPSTEADCEPTPYRQEFVRGALNDWLKHAFLVFRQIPDDKMKKLDCSDPKDRRQCLVRICFGLRGNADDVGWAAIGAHARFFIPESKPGHRYATVFLSGVPRDSQHAFESKELANARSTVFHELGHVLALRHEHCSPYSPIKTPDDQPKFPLTKVMMASAFDPYSVMLYENLPYENDPGRFTSLNSWPSPVDYAIVRLLYPDNAKADGEFAKALKLMISSDKERGYLLGLAAKAFAINDEDDRAKEIRYLRERIGRKMEYDAERRKIHSSLLGDGDVKPAPTVTPTKAPGFLYELVEALKQFFNPGNGQRFTLQFPGRFLDQNSYAWDTASAGIHGQFIKPTAVNEAEFRLVDQLYDLNDTVGGPNGTNLSIVYDELLNNMLPKYVDNGLAQQQNEIRKWLTHEVPVTPWIRAIMETKKARDKALAEIVARGLRKKVVEEPEKDKKELQASKNQMINRIELSQLLMDEYLYAKQEWELERDELINEASKSEIGTAESQRALNELTRKLAHITASRQARLAGLYNDAVVRGHAHTVKEYMGYLDIAGPAEFLQRAKDSMREAAMSSLDGSMRVFPVQLTPLDWFEGLSTSFTMEDLTQDPELIRIRIDAKSKHLDSLNMQLTALQMGAKGDPKSLEEKLAAAQTAADAAQSALLNAYSSNVIAMAKTCLDALGKVDTKMLASKTSIAEELLKPIGELMTNARNAHDALISTMRVYSDTASQLALAKATDTKQQQQQIKLQINSLTDDLKELQTRWQMLTSFSGGVNPSKPKDTSQEAVPTTPVELPKEKVSGGSRWQTISFTSSSATRTSLAQSHASASSDKWSCNLWYASASGSSSSSSASSSTSTKTSEDNIEVAFRATLVTIDRGGWFQPQFFKQSQAFYKINKDITWVNQEVDGKTVKGLMPGFPVAFLLAKDIVIRITHSSTSSSDSSANDKANSEVGGGFLCFSISKGSASQSGSESSNFEPRSNGYIVKIPGPQILGYMIQETDADQGELMPAKLDHEKFFVPKEEGDQTLKGAPDGSGTVAPDSDSSPQITQEQLKEILANMMNDKIGELFKQLNGGAK